MASSDKMGPGWFRTALRQIFGTLATQDGAVAQATTIPGVPVPLYFPITLTDTDTPADLVTDYILPFAGSIISYQYVTEVAATSGGTADADIELHLDATAITGSKLEGLTQDDFSAVGKVKAGGTITALNTFAAGEKFSVVCTESAVNFTAGVIGLHVHCLATDLTGALKTANLMAAA